MGREESKHKRCRKETKHRKVKKSDSDASSSGSSTDEWVEKEVKIPVTHSADKPARDDWMSEQFSIPTYSKESRKSTKTNLKGDEAKLDYSSRELNPYWKNGGNGLPQENVKRHSNYDIEYLYKSLERCKETAREKNGSLEDVAAEYWGSLDRLKSLIAEAESKRDRIDDDGKRSSSYRRKKREHCSKFVKPADDSDDNDEGSERFHKNSASYHSDKKSHHSRNTRESSASRYDSSSYRSKGWKKPHYSQNTENISASRRDNDDAPSKKVDDDSKPVGSLKDDLNSLAAKLLKAKIMGNKELVNELTAKLDKAKSMRGNSSKDTVKEEIVLLTNTNSQGFSQPVLPSSSESNRKRKFETYRDGKRVRYFEEDDKCTLKEMFENEKMCSVRDQNLEFSNLVHKNKSDVRHDTDDMFMDQITDKSKKQSHVQNAIQRHRRDEKYLDDCRRCLNSRDIEKHLVITTGTKSYLSVPGYQSLTKGHCLIIPTSHATCGTLVDEDVWQEIKMFCKNLIKMFQDKGLYVVFYEIAARFNRLPHMILNCVPLPNEIGNSAAGYFKKSILECEKEWATNKKLVDIRNMDVKRSIPKGLPYFMVHFGMDKGFAHVIENERDFPLNFAEEIIGGMLDMDHTVWRKHRNDSFDVQCKKVSNFKNWWKDYNWMDE